MNSSENRIRIAMQKSGRLSEDSMQLLQKCGIQLKTYGAKLFAQSTNFPLDVLLVRDDDIPDLLFDGMCDFGIVGQNVLHERALQRDEQFNPANLPDSRILNFGQCHLAIAVPDNFEYLGIQSLQNKRIATTYPRLLKNFLNAHNIKAHITVLTGSVEIAPHLELSDAICDLVSTGATLAANGLREVATVLRSEVVLVRSTSVLTPEKQLIAELFQRRLDGVLAANETKYIMLHAPISALAQIVEVLPGSKYPTVIPLQQDQAGFVAVHAVCRESIFWETMEKLKAAGASSILVVPVEKMLL